MLDLVLVTLICWSLAAWLFWKWGLPLRVSNAVKEREKNTPHINRTRF
jgi:hypothetical protein